MNSNYPQSMTIVIVDGTQASELMRSGNSNLPVPNGNLQTPNVAENIINAIEAPSTNSISKQMITPFMPTLNQISGGIIGQANSAINKFKSVATAFSTGATAVGGAIIIAELTNYMTKQIVKTVKDEMAKAEKENASNLLKIRAGDIQMQAGVYRSSVNIFGKVKYNTN